MTSGSCATTALHTGPLPLPTTANTAIAVTWLVRYGDGTIAFVMAQDADEAWVHGMTRANTYPGASPSTAGRRVVAVEVAS